MNVSLNMEYGRFKLMRDVAHKFSSKRFLFFQPADLISSLISPFRNFMRDSRNRVSLVQDCEVIGLRGVNVLVDDLDLSVDKPLQQVIIDKKTNDEGKTEDNECIPPHRE